MIIVQTAKDSTRATLKREISKARPCTYFVIQCKDDAVNNGYKNIVDQYSDHFFEQNNLIVITDC